MFSSTDTKSLWDPSNSFGNPASLKLWLWPYFKINPNSPDFRHKQAGKPCWVHVGPNPPFASNESKELSLRHSTGKLVFDNGLPKKLRFHDHVRILNLIKSCQKEKDLLKSRTIHSYLLEKHILTKNVYIGNALVTTYAKCGVMEEAREVFEQLPVKSVVSWSALIEGYAQLGEANMALNMYERMKAENFVPNLVTFTVLLTACSHAGLVGEGQKLFDEMRIDYHLTPTLEHYSCMIDLFGRAGHFDKAIGVIKRLPSSGYLPAWSALLGACRKWENVKLGRLAFEYAVKLDAKSAVPYFCMSSLYAASGIRRDGFKQRFEEVSRKPGSNWLTINANI